MCSKNHCSEKVGCISNDDEFTSCQKCKKTKLECAKLIVTFSPLISLRPCRKHFVPTTIVI